jgi:hypothetical protein
MAGNPTVQSGAFFDAFTIRIVEFSIPSVKTLLHFAGVFIS